MKNEVHLSLVSLFNEISSFCGFSPNLSKQYIYIYIYIYVGRYSAETMTDAD